MPLLIVVLLGIAVFLLTRTTEKTSTPVKKKSSEPSAEPVVNRNRGFDRRTSFLKYSNHADCRMECRKISKQEVEEIMREGKINYNKSDIKNARCPRYALEGITSDEQRVRIIYAQCDESTTVVTVIDLGKDWQCDCPGDDDKYQNRK